MHMYLLLSHLACSHSTSRQLGQCCCWKFGQKCYGLIDFDNETRILLEKLLVPIELLRVGFIVVGSVVDYKFMMLEALGTIPDLYLAAELTSHFPHCFE